MGTEERAESRDRALWGSRKQGTAGRPVWGGREGHSCACFGRCGSIGVKFPKRRGWRLFQSSSFLWTGRGKDEAATA